LIWLYISSVPLYEKKISGKFSKISGKFSKISAAIYRVCKKHEIMEFWIFRNYLQIQSSFAFACFIHTILIQNSPEAARTFKNCCLTML